MSLIVLLILLDLVELLRITVINCTIIRLIFVNLCWFLCPVIIKQYVLTVTDYCLGVSG